MKRAIRVTVNRTEHVLSVEPCETLLDLLRNHLNLTGAKLGCDQQVCGACTVLLDGLPVSSCTVLAVDVDARQVLSIEGLAEGQELHPIQHAFLRHSAFQCAYCTPGMIMAIKALQDQVPRANDDQIRHFLAGNICRCGCHVEILEVARAILGTPSTPPREVLP